MAMVNFKKGLLANLPSTYTEGTFYVTTDERAIYLDVSGEARIRLGDFQEFANLEALQKNTNPSTSALYYVTDINCLAKWNGSAYVQINRDTGMTSVEVTGEGNAVTAAVYDEAGRKLTLTKGATYMTAADVDGKIGAKVGNLGDSATVKDYVDAKTAGIASDAALKELGTRVTTAEGEIDALQAAVGEGGSVDTKIANAINALDKVDAPVDGQYVDAVSEDNGIITVSRKALPDYSNTYDAKGAAAQALTDAKAYADGKDAAIAAAKNAADTAQGDVDALEVLVGSIPKGATSKTVTGYVDEAIGKAVDAIPAQTDYTVTVTESTPEGYAKAYTIAQAATGLNTVINIPKDMVVSSGSVVTNPASQPAGTYLKLVLANATEDEIFINVGDLIEYVTSGSTSGDQIMIAVSPDHKVTATLSAGSVTLAQLHADVRAEIAKAHTHANAAELDKFADGDKAKLDAAAAAQHTHANKAELDKIAVGDKAKWDAAEQNAKNYADGLAANYDAAGSAASAETNAKSYADQKIAALDKADAAVTGQYVSAVSEEDGVITVSRTALPDYTNTYDAKGSAAAAEQNAKDYADSLIVWGSF